MNRRAFFGTMIGGVAATAAVRTWPFRVFSFPSEIKIARWYDSWENFDIAKVPPAGTDPALEKQIHYLQQVWLEPNGCLFDGDGECIVKNGSNQPIILHRPTLVRGNWKCVNGIAIIEGTNA